ncbi:bifunctional chorismate mutase/prephenate dehydratase [Sinanaerobacter chloroacetimidivorans]|uniref:Bifunctional chorismate mutase/prephenate dehydratase n=1 Tax=Sinanaerobacter chloroacetimidivorans TaxID=2818044 RepID=A0A8J7VXY5_9FIRM|nr:bifunctional chorismate mutase/prephenate dehydratase [Sinanaerobacter chloroacetimidivorans]MBR0596751.1 chorismate mutase [Sinanaerobacter chloroacetimidivorans]
MTLDEIRKEIDEIDIQMKELFQRRMKAAERVAESKFRTKDKILKPEREEQVIRQLTAGLDKELEQEYISFVKKMMEVSRTHQYKKTIILGAAFEIACQKEELPVRQVCYQGLPGSYSEMAAGSMFPNCQYTAVSTFEDVFSQVSEGSSDIGIVPLENTTAGGVYEVYDLLLKYNLYINCSDIVKVEHCLAGIKGASLEDIKEVYSHPQAILQSKEFLKSRGITAKVSSNTAVAAQDVFRENDLGRGAICSIAAAKRYGLNILIEGINHNKENATKFVAVSKHLISRPNHNRIALVFACSHRSGSLASVLGIFGDYGVNLTEIHSRPDGKHAWEYLFYVDFTGNLQDERMRVLFYQLTEELPYVKILGSYESKQ